MSSGGHHAFQLAQEERRPEKLMASMEWGVLAVLVQSQRRHLFRLWVGSVMIARVDGNTVLVRVLKMMSVSEMSSVGASYHRNISYCYMSLP